MRPCIEGVPDHRHRAERELVDGLGAGLKRQGQRNFPRTLMIDFPTSELLARHLSRSNTP
ncbi:hypothetical protein [Thioclava dalianensis]|uniref:hypothetical protein n=1 Tax=Thioclava dalianensis TaxID=1185766 RepID=UPI00116011D4|nr:hypothetical protein [Thioclava dalianensis]